MSHRHFCDFAGHDWYCDGTALRPDAGDTKPSTCMCLVHHVSMEEGDHSHCPVELLACPEHLGEQQRIMKETAIDITPSEDHASPETKPFHDDDGNPIVGFCFWCGKDFYSHDEVWAHNANHMAACPDFQEFLRQQPSGNESPATADGVDEDESQGRSK